MLAPPNILTQPVGRVVGVSSNFTVELTNLEPPQIGYYSVGVTNVFGGIVSSNAGLNLTDYPFVLWQGLLAWYPFNGNAADASGSGFNGTTNGGTFFSSDRFGKTSASVSFDGTIGFVSVNDPAGGLNFDARSNNYSVKTWVDLADTNNDYCLVNDGGTTQTLPASYTLRFIAAYDRFQFALWDGTLWYLECRRLKLAATLLSRRRTIADSSAPAVMAPAR